MKQGSLKIHFEINDELSPLSRQRKRGTRTFKVRTAAWKSTHLALAKLWLNLNSDTDSYCDTKPNSYILYYREHVHTAQTRTRIPISA